ncbi:MAG: hypothetical protein ACK5JH_04245 [Anaerocolumna sp.]
MVQELFDKNVFIYIMFGLLGGGIFLKLILTIIYSRLVKASDNMSTSKNKLTKTMKKKFEACFKLKIGVNNVDIFVDKYVYRQRFCGILLSTWDNICGQILILCLLIGSISTIMGLVYECGKQQILSTFSVGILTSGLLIFLEGLTNIGAKKELLRLNMKDYLENILKVRLEQENESPELIEEYKKEYLNEEYGQAINSATLLAATSDKQSTRKSKPSKFTKKQEKVKLNRAKKEEKIMEKEAKKDRAKTEALKKVENKKLAKVNKSSEKTEAKRKLKEEKERLKHATKQAIEKKKENEKAEIERIRALAREEEEKRKSDKLKHKEIKKMLLLEKKLSKKIKQKSKKAKQKSQAQENKENLMREFSQRKNVNAQMEEFVVEQLVEQREAFEEKMAATLEIEQENVIIPTVEMNKELVKIVEIKQERVISPIVEPVKVHDAKVYNAKTTEVHFSKPENVAANKSEEPPVVKEITLREKKIKASTPEEAKLFEDILKEFLA